MKAGGVAYPLSPRSSERKRITDIAPIAAPFQERHLSALRVIAMALLNTPISDLAASIRLSRKLSERSHANLIEASPILVDAIRHRSGQSRKIQAILWSLWNDEHPVSLCDALRGCLKNSSSCDSIQHPLSH